MDLGKTTIQSTEKIKSRPRWRPISLNPILLTSMVSFTLFIIVVLAVLQSKSNQDGGILFSKDIVNFPAGLTFVYLYSPTIVAVFYTTVWNWIDLDTKRLEPWYQLSQRTGSSASESILLQYPAEFLASVPISSMKRRQWAVFCTSTVLVILFWAVTPLQSGIFAVSPIRKSTIQPMTSSPGFISLEEQSQALTLNFVNNGYDVAWLGQKPPAFTTTAYALVPFLPFDGQILPGSNRTWTGKTVLYDTDLNCQPAVSVTDSHNTSNYLTFDNGRGCIARNIVPSWEPSEPSDPLNITAYYIGLQRAGCNSSSLHEFLAVWKRTDETPNFRNASSFTALFCSTKYSQQDVEATVRLSDYSVQHVRPLGEKKELPEEMFNYTLFETLIVTQTLARKPENSTSPQADSVNRHEISDSTSFDHSMLATGLGVYSPSVLVPFALGMSQLSPEALLEPSQLHHAFESTHRMLFALAAQSIMEAPTETGKNISGVVEASIGAVVMVETFTFLVIGFLSLVVALSIYLLCIQRNRILKLRHRPDSIASVMAVVHQQTDLLPQHRWLGSVKGETILRRLENCLFSLQFHGQGSQLVITSRPEVEEEMCIIDTNDSAQVQPWPWELSPFGGCLFILILIGSILSTTILQMLIQRQNGLRLPSNSAIVQQLLLNLLPTALGTMLEPFWVVLNRLLCILQPFFELSKDTASASRSLLAEYTSVPPQLVFLRALRAKHWLLVTVCAVTAGANILTVGLSGLFEIRNINQKTSVYCNSNFLPKFYPPNETSGASGNFGQPLQVMIANLSANVALPPWVSSEYYFVPLEIPSDGNSSDLSYSIATTGIASQLNCQELKESDSDLLFRFILNHDATEANFTVSETLPDGSSIRCFSPNAFIGDDAKAPAETTQIYLCGSPEGRKGIELFIQPISSYVSATPQETFACPRMLIAGWVRSTISLGGSFSKTLYGPTRNVTSVSVNSTFMMCKPRFQMANFDVIVNQQGNVLNYTRNGPLSEKVDESLAWSIWNATTFLVGAPPDTFTWHNDTLASDWFNLLIKEFTDSTSIIDPNDALPDFSTMADLVSKVYQELFAATVQSNQNYLITSHPGKSVVAEGIRNEPRIFMSAIMFKIVLIILILDVIVAILVYIRLPRPFLHRMPTSIAALLSYVSHSHLLQDLKEADAHGDKISESLAQKGNVYGFGRYIGTDNEVHVGIERQPYLVPQHTGQLSKLQRLRTATLLTRSSKTSSAMI